MIPKATIRLVKQSICVMLVLSVFIGCDTNKEVKTNRSDYYIVKQNDKYGYINKGNYILV